MFGRRRFYGHNVVSWAQYRRGGLLGDRRLWLLCAALIGVMLCLGLYPEDPKQLRRGYDLVLRQLLGAEVMVLGSDSRCRLGHIYDGDSVKLECAEGVRRARLLGFDTPEHRDALCPSEKQAAKAARDALVELTARAKILTVVIKGQDKYRRDLVQLFIDGRDVAEIMISAGHARPYGGGKRMGWCGAEGAES